jgi:uncharacterized phage protein (TIGR01671 family)
VWDGIEFYFTTENIHIYPRGFSDYFGLSFAIKPNKRVADHPTNSNKKTELVIQQFTGFTDRSGKEIYEGDIFKGGTYGWSPVEFEHGQWRANLKGARVFSLYELFDDVPKGDHPVVIGNMFENSELL